MLFQPSNILPDVINGSGNGTVDLVDGFAPSWQVNGNSQMTAYCLYIYENNAASTYVWDTDPVTLSTPFSGIDYQGNIQRFTANLIAGSTLTNAGVQYGKEYKLKIVQYYLDEGGTETSIEQRSMSVFRVRHKPTVTIATISSDTIATREYSFTATYAQTEGNPMAWARWQLYYLTPNPVNSNYTEELIEDTGKMYGVTELRFDYDAFLNNNSYRIKVTAEDINGVQTTASKTFSTSWSEAVLTEDVNPTAKRVNRQSTAVKVVWNGFKYIKGEPVGDVQVKNGTAIIGNGASYVSWSEINGTPLSLEDPWVLMMKTKLNQGDAQIIKLYDSSDNVIVNIYYDLANRAVKCVANGVSGTLSDSIVNYTDTVSIMVTPTEYQIKAEGYAGKLMPSATLTPSATLVPNEKTQKRTFSPNAHSISAFTQTDIAKVEVGGIQNVDFVQMICGSDNVTESRINAMKQRLFNLGSNYDPDMDTFPGTEFLATFNNRNLDAGRLTVAGTAITGWAIYRESQRLNEMLHMLDTDVAMSSFYDYGCGSNQGKYRYLIYPIGDQKYITAGLYTDWIEPCYENWSIVEAKSIGANSYEVQNEYVFGKNFSSGSVSNNNAPTVSKNFTKYATVQMDNANFQSGTLSGLIGYIGYISYVVQKGDTLYDIAVRFNTTADQIIEDNVDLASMEDLTDGQIIKVFYPEGITSYNDDKELRDSIWALSTTQNYLFLKSRKGDVIEIRVAGEISMETMDASAILPTTVSVPWVQVGDATRVKLIGGIS